MKFKPSLLSNSLVTDMLIANIIDQRTDGIKLQGPECGIFSDRKVIPSINHDTNRILLSGLASGFNIWVTFEMSIEEFNSIYFLEIDLSKVVEPSEKWFRDLLRRNHWDIIKEDN